MRLHLREANTQFDKMELYSYMQDCIIFNYIVYTKL